MSLGAQRHQLLQLMLFDGLRLRSALFGLGLGLLLNFAATHIFQSMLSGTRPLDPMVLSGVIATLLAVAVLACLAPAWRFSARSNLGHDAGARRSSCKIISSAISVDAQFEGMRSIIHTGGMWEC